MLNNQASSNLSNVSLVGCGQLGTVPGLAPGGGPGPEIPREHAVDLGSAISRRCSDDLDIIPPIKPLPMGMTAEDGEACRREIRHDTIQHLSEPEVAKVGKEIGFGSCPHMPDRLGIWRHVGGDDDVGRTGCDGPQVVLQQSSGF